jgi:hemerythrin-like domain-containing protein
MTPNFATIVHKFIRSEMFGVSLALSTCDASAPDAVVQASARLERVANLLRTHGAREDEGLLPLLRDKDPEAAARMERDHQLLDQRLARVCAAASALPNTVASLRESALLLVYLDWNAFLSAYFAHLDDEECALFPLLGDAIPGVEAMAATPAQIPPEGRAGFLDALWRAIAPGERAVIEAALADQEAFAKESVAA